MKKLTWLIVAMLLWLMATSTALALSDCLKDPAFCRTGVITIVTTPTTTNCSDCSKTATATYVGNSDRDGFWLTSAHAVDGAKQLWVDGVLAEMVAQGCPSSLRCKGGERFGCAWVMLKTANYLPCGACPAEAFFDGPYCGQDLFYVDITKCKTVTKVVVIEVDKEKTSVFKTTTLPDCANCGAIVYDHCGRMIGIMIGGGKDKCSNGCTKERYSKFIRLNNSMFKIFASETSGIVSTQTQAVVN